MRKQVLDEARIEQQRQPAAEEMIRSRARRNIMTPVIHVRKKNMEIPEK